jgi:hypothetical protein
LGPIAAAEAGGPPAVVHYDYDNDGDLDVLYRNAGDGRFVQLADVDADGDLDLFYRSAGDGRFVQLADVDADGYQDFFIAEPEPIKLSDHWIGAGCQPADAALRSHLNLPEGQGLLVRQVVADGPAAKGGLKQHDVLVKAGGKPLGRIQDLIDAVDAVKDKELKLDLVRGGKERTVTVKPVKRPEDLPAEALPWQRGLAPHEAFRQWVEQMQPWQGDRPWRLRFWGPGTILPPGAKTEPPLPGNFSVTVTKTGDEPAKIVVKQDDQKWEVTEDGLDKLPPDVRSHVERVLGRTGRRGAGKTVPFDLDFVPQWRPGEAPWSGGRMERQMQEMNRRIDELRKSLEELRQKRPRLKRSEPDAEEGSSKKGDDV